jgi:predicted kinase
LLQLAQSRLQRGRVTLTLVGGGPATGKSTLAAGIGDRRGWPVLRSDEIRKDLAGIGHETRAVAAPGGGIYDRAHTDETYAELLRRARALLELGHPAVLDATWADARHRRAAALVARETSSDLVALQCDVSLVEAEARAARRLASTDPSDATGEIVRDAATRFEPWPEATRVPTAGTPADALDDALRGIDEQLAAVSLAPR